MMVSLRIQTEWRNRIAAEYTSATITQQLTLWLMVLGAPPDLIADGLRIVSDELEHSRLSTETYLAAGGSEPPALVREQLGVTRRFPALEADVIATVLGAFCLGETVAVPLFSYLRKECSQPSAKTALDRILVDEVRHRDFGWDTLDWLLASQPQEMVRSLALAALPELFSGLFASYGVAGVGSASTVPVSAAERDWGLGEPARYSEILANCFERDYLPRFLARGIDPTSAWRQALAASSNSQ